MMMANTASQLNAYHSWNPQMYSVPGTATLYTPSFSSLNLKTLLEANKHTTWLQNMSLNNKMCITAYLVKPRKPITTVELPAGEVKFTANTSLTLPTAGSITDALLALMNNSFAQNSTGAPIGQNPNFFDAPKSGKFTTGIPSTSTSKFSSDALFIPGETPFNSQWFVQRFKVLKTRKTVLGPGKRCKLSMTMPPRQLSWANNDWVYGASAYQSPFVMWPHTRFWMISFHGAPAPFLTKTDGTGNLAGVDCPPSVLGFYHVEQFCLRQSIPNTIYKTSQRISAKTDLGTSTAVTFGHIPKISETATTGAGGKICDIAAGVVTNPSNVVVAL